MTEIDRANVLRDLDSRHDELLQHLESLNQQIEAALQTVRPSAADAAPSAAKGRSK